MDLLEKAAEIMLNFGSNEWQTKFCELPGLMNEELLVQLETRTNEMSAEIRQRVTGFITVARHIEEQMRTAPAGYPLGSGPLEQIFLKIAKGHFGMEVAKQQACQMAQNKELHTSYLRALSFRCVQLSYQGSPQDALSMQFLISEAAGLMLDDSQHAMRAKLAVELIRSASWVLNEKGDASIYHQALLVGEQELLRAVTADEKAELNYGLGILHLDPYTATRPLGWNTTGIRQWFAAGNNPPECELGSADGLPLPQDALATAESHLRLACQLGEGEIRRDALKALIQTLESGRAIDLVPDDKELISLCDEALELLKQTPNPEKRAYITEVRNQAAGNLSNIQPNNKEHLQIESLDTLIAQKGANAGLDVWITGIGLLVKHEPEESLSKIVKERNLFMLKASEALRGTLWRHELTAMSQLADHYSDANDQAADLGSLWHAVEAGLEAYKNNNEISAGEELVSAINQYPDKAQQHAEALRWLSAVLEVGAGTNAFNSNDVNSAARYYSLALLNFIDLKASSDSCEMIDRLDQIVAASEGEALKTVIIGLSLAGVRLDLLLGYRSQQVLYPISVNLLQRCLSVKVSSVELIWSMEFAKGRIYSALLHQGEESKYALPTNLEPTLSATNDLERSVITDHPDEWGLSDESVLGAFLTQSAPSAGKDSSSQLRNLRLTFDESITRDRLSKVAVQSALTTTKTTVIDQLPEDTVLLDICIARRQLVTLAYTSEGMETFVVKDETELGGAQIKISDDTLSASYRYSALLVESLRGFICAEPGPFEVDRKAQLLLDQMLRRLLGNGVEKLQEWWEMGKRHLCIVPYGAFHFLPIHLLNWNGKPLAEQWSVSYLPNISLLTSSLAKYQQTSSSSRRCASLGLSYTGHPYLPPISNSIKEVSSVASTMGVTPIIDNDVTNSTVKETLKSCARIHISCHGKIYPESPELQHFFLASIGEIEQKLYAYELASLDLNHVDLISLSACQSGLGRFDYNDNLRGLQANLFISGVSSIVDTLWDVSANASETFFKVFYQQLGDQKSMRVSFRKAQQATREANPAYRDWGAFRLSGKW